MKGIRLSHGVTFVEYKGMTFRILPSGECGVSPILYGTLEWDLRTEPPGTWEYVGEADIKALGDEIFGKIEALAATSDL